MLVSGSILTRNSLLGFNKGASCRLDLASTLLLITSVFFKFSCKKDVSVSIASKSRSLICTLESSNAFLTASWTGTGSILCMPNSRAILAPKNTAAKVAEYLRSLPVIFQALSIISCVSFSLTRTSSKLAISHCA